MKVGIADSHMDVSILNHLLSSNQTLGDPFKESESGSLKVELQSAR